MTMLYTIWQGKIFVPANEEPAGYGDYVGELVGTSRYVGPDLPLYVDGDPDKSFGCFGYIALDKPEGMQRVMTEPSVCDVCKFRLPCNLGINRNGNAYVFTQMSGKTFKFARPFELVRFKDENQFIAPEKLSRRKKATPEDFEWTA